MAAAMRPSMATNARFAFRAFVRFASVYRRFEDAGDFVDEVETLLSDARDAARRPR